MLNLNKLLFNSAEPRAFVNNILPTDEQRTALVAAKNAIRDHLRDRIAQATVSQLGMRSKVVPRFRTQGSWSYNTCIQAGAMPPQEMDWDFGVYLPVDVWEENGPPHKMARAYFVLVEGLLEDLCQRRGWRLVDGKKTCIRVQVADWAHIDVPLYAAPANDFARIQERALVKAAKTASVHDSLALEDRFELGEYSEQAWEDLDAIMMACRSGEWMASDPETVARWFNDAVLVHTEQLRRVCRYVKAWRDKWWIKGGPTSVSLMIAVAQKFEHKRTRDDLALEHAFRTLEKALASDIRELGIDGGAEDFNRLDPVERLEAARRAGASAAAFHAARMRTVADKAGAIAQLRGELGDRIPHEPQLVEADTVAGEVLSTPAKRVVAPVVWSTSAG
jgi:hypothetical protein